MRGSSTFSILFWTYKGRSKNNKTSIYAGITVNGKKVKINLKEKVCWFPGFQVSKSQGEWYWIPNSQPLSRWSYSRPSQVLPRFKRGKSCSYSTTN